MGLSNLLGLVEWGLELIIIISGKGMKMAIKRKFTTMDKHYLAKVVIDGETIMLEMFPELTKMLDGNYDPDTIPPVVERIKAMEGKEKAAWIMALRMNEL